MPRKREGSVTESPQQLEALLQAHAGDTCELRLRMLLYLSTRPAATINEVASAIDCSERTVRRWWKAYQKGGLKELAGDGAECADLPDQATSHESSSDDVLVSSRVVKFLNALPVINDTVEWTNAFRAALKRLLGDVDRMSINIHTGCDVYGSEEQNIEFLLTQHVRSGRSRVTASAVVAQRADRPPAERLLDNLASGGFPLHELHPPSYFDYYAPNGNYLGTIFLWRSKHAPPISRRTLETMRALEPFIIFLLSDCIARRSERPDQIGATTFSRIVMSINQSYDLTSREQQVLLHCLMGQSSGEITTHLNISLNTLRKHVKAIYRKTGARNFAELFARYFTPLEI